MSPERSSVFTWSGDQPGVATSARAEGTEGTIETVEVRTLQAFDRLRPAWDALVERLDLPSPFHSWEWNRRWWDHFGTGKRLRLLLFNRGRSLIGIAQFYERRIPLVAGGVLVPLGWEDTARKQGLSEQWELLFPTADRPELWEALGSWLTRTRRGFTMFSWAPACCGGGARPTGTSSATAWTAAGCGAGPRRKMLACGATSPSCCPGTRRWSHPGRQPITWSPSIAAA